MTATSIPDTPIASVEGDLLIGLLAKVTSMVKQSPAENKARIKEYMRILDIGRRFDALTVRHAWAEKIEAFRDSILEDPFM